MRVAAALFILAAALGCSGLGSSSQCPISGINVSPQAVTIDHTAAPPANSQMFLAFQTSSSPGCSFTAAQLQNAFWTVSDPVNASISNSHDQNNINYGRATCINAASSPITVSASVPSGNGSIAVGANATLTCK